MHSILKKGSVISCAAEIQLKFIMFKLIEMPCSCLGDMISWLITKIAYKYLGYNLEQSLYLNFCQIFLLKIIFQNRVLKFN